MNASSLLMLFAFGGASFGAASAGAIFRPGDWYRRLDKPRWRPPDWLFAPGLDAALCDDCFVGMAGLAGEGARRCLGAAHRLCGPARPERRLDADLLRAAAAGPRGDRDRDGLWASIVATIFFFYPVSPSAAGLLVPYLVWVSFAAALNISIWRRNPPAQVAKGAR